MIIVFNSFAANLEAGASFSLTPSLSEFATLDVQDQGGLFVKRINPDVINIFTSNYNQSILRLESGQTNGFFLVPSNSVELVQQGESISTVLYLNYKDPRRSVVRDEVNTTTKTLAAALRSNYLQSLNNQSTGVSQENTGESLPMQIIKKVMIVILLFLPIFLFGNLIIDSIVGEKEKKTSEILIAMPISPGNILLGKSLAVILIMALQVAMWMIILLGAGFEIKNAFLVYLTIVLTALPTVAITTIIATYAKNYKEAGIGISFVYIFIAGFLIIPVLAYLSRQSPLADISPMTLAVQLFSGETVPLIEAILPFIIILIVTIISFLISITLFKRDDIIFGPRPGILRLILEFIGIKKPQRLK
jgi:ABC-2 type transport system permease protein